MQLWKRFWNEEDGQDLVEYTLLLAFVALASAALFITSGQQVSSIWSATQSRLVEAAGAATGS